ARIKTASQPGVLVSIRCSSTRWNFGSCANRALPTRTAPIAKIVAPIFQLILRMWPPRRPRFEGAVSAHPILSQGALPGYRVGGSLAAGAARSGSRSDSQLRLERRPVDHGAQLRELRVQPEPDAEEEQQPPRQPHAQHSLLVHQDGAHVGVE